MVQQPHSPFLAAQPADEDGKCRKVYCVISMFNFGLRISAASSLSMRTDGCEISMVASSAPCHAVDQLPANLRSSQACPAALHALASARCCWQAQKHSFIGRPSIAGRNTCSTVGPGIPARQRVPRAVPRCQGICKCWSTPSPNVPAGSCPIHEQRLGDAHTSHSARERVSGTALPWRTSCSRAPMCLDSGSSCASALACTPAHSVGWCVCVSDL